MINNGGSSATATFETTLAAGSYCNAVTGGVEDGKCADGKIYKVGSNGSLKATVQAYSAIVLYVGGQPDQATTSTVASGRYARRHAAFSWAV